MRLWKGSCSLSIEDLGRHALHLLSGVERVNCVQMALVYRKSTKSVARKYERSPGMEPNVGGVTHMAVINPGRPRGNPFQWIRGAARGRHQHVSPTYRTMKGSRSWAQKHPDVSSGARLVAVDEFGTIMARPMSRKQVLRNRGRSSMAYNLNALKRAMRKNMSEADRAAIMSAARSIDTGGASGSKKRRRRKSKRRSSTKVRGGKITARASKKRTSKRKSSKRRSSKRTSPKRRSAARSSKRRSSKRRSSKRRSSKRRSSKRSSKKGRASAKGASRAAKSASKQASAAKKAATRAKRATSKKAASKAAKSARKHASKAAKAARSATSKAAKAKRSSKRAASKAAAKARREAAKAAKAAAAAATASRRAEHRGRLSRRHGKFAVSTKAYGTYKGRAKGWSASPFRTGRLFNPPFIHITSKHPKRRAARISMAANMLGRISQRRGLPHGQRVQLVEFGPRSKRKGYAVYVPGHVSERGYVRRFTFGGAARDAHARAMRSGYSKKRYSKKRVSANGRSSMRRNSKKRHSRHSKRRVSRNGRRSRRRHSKRMHGNRYVVVKNRHRRRRLRRNMTIFGVDPVKQVAIPGAYAVGGLMLANAASNAVAAMPAVTGMLDAGREDPIVTKSLVGAGVAGLAIAFGGKLPPMLRENLGPIVAGMGCAVAVRLLRGTQAAPYLGRWGAGFGEYVDQPLGAYVQDPSMGEYVDQPLGEYVDQPLGGLGAPTMYAAAGYPEGIDPADQDSVDGLMDVMEAAAGVGAYEAAAGMGTLYAAAGLGADAGTPGVVGAPIPLPTFTPARGSDGLQQPPFVSTVTPIDMAKEVSAVMNRDLPIRRSLVTPEGRGSAGGIFSRSIFGGMMS